MRRRLQRIVGTGLLLALAAGCAFGAGGATDLPHPRAVPSLESGDEEVIPVTHPPDGLVVAREPYSRFERKLDVAFMKVAPYVLWPIFAVAVIF